jgi:1-acyl-sn-glycerol-3-phosphate acyltransferase
MHRTIFDTPVINTLMRLISRTILGALGWRIEGKPPRASKYVLIAAPHTSNWDFPLTLMVCFSLQIKVYWMGKASLFPPVMGSIMRWLGGIPVDRSRQGNLVQSTVDAFNQSKELIVIVPPEGTRAKVTQWKSGFYYIAHGAGLPIALGYMDYAKKIAGVETLFHPSGDIAVDLPQIQAFYNGISGKNPKQF